MLPSALLLASQRSAQVYPKFLKPAQHVWAQAVLDLVADYKDKTRGELLAALRALEGDSPDYRIVRGFAHLALNDAEFTFGLEKPEPEALRQEAFTLAAQQGYGEQQTQTVVAELAERYELEPDTLGAALYADLPERHILVRLPDFSAESLIDRYNLAQAQGLLYSAFFLQLVAHRNVPGEYQRLFRQLKFYGLMYAVEGNLEDGYQISIDGPASLFKQTRKYGIKMALFLPALLHIKRWQMVAELQRSGKQCRYVLNSDSPLRSHYAKPPAYDSLLERSFAERWAKLKTDWVLEREVEIIDLKGTVFLPDFALRHPDGRVVHVEIVGYWRPEYLRRKFDKARRANMNNLILAISDRLNVGDDDLQDIPGPCIFFKGKLDPKRVLELIESIG